MRHVGIREFKSQATSMLRSGETLVIERYGKPVGFFVPIEAKDRVAGRAALGRLSQTVEKLLQQTGLTEDEFVREVTGVKRTRR